MEIDYSNAGLWTLMVATFTLAVTHSVNPDHWFPFVMVGRANKWRLSWVLALATIAGIGHVGTSAAIGLIGVFAEKGASKEIAQFLEDGTPVLLMIFGFTYAAYHFYRQRVGAHGHSHGIPIINKWLGIDPHAYDLPDHEHVHTHSHHEPSIGIHLGKVELYLHNMELHVAVAHQDHTHDHDVTGEENHVHGHTHGDEVAHNHEHVHASAAHPHAREHDGHSHDNHSQDEHDHAHTDHEHPHASHDRGHVRDDHDHDSHEHQTHSHDGHGHTHETHDRDKPRADLRGKKAGWALVAILGLTPCIALLPLTMASVKYGTMAIILVNICFALGTIGAILVLTWLGLMGLSWLKFEFFERNGDIITGLIIGFIGAAVKIFQL